MAEKLKPCPFCGGEAQRHEAMGETWIECADKCQKMRGVCAVNEAIEAWNMRTLAEVEEMKKRPDTQDCCVLAHNEAIRMAVREAYSYEVWGGTARAKEIPRDVGNSISHLIKPLPKPSAT